MVVIIVFGATGDLMKRKLIPAFAQLQKKGTFSGNIIAVGRRDFDNEQYKTFLLDSMPEHKDFILKLPIHYCKADISHPESLQALIPLLKKFEQGSSEGRVFYLATSYEFFSGILNALENLGLSKQHNAWNRIVFEKPFGKDLQSFLSLEEDIHRVFKEEDIFRIDHYLAKETVQNLTALRFANPFMEQIFSHDVIERIEVIVDEDLGVENRLGYYHEVGAVKDMVQNHLLQVLSLLLIDAPSSIHSQALHLEKVKALESLSWLPPMEQLLGQYASYQEEVKAAGLIPGQTETFARLLLTSSLERWKGTTFLLRTGKRLPTKYGQIHLYFKSSRYFSQAEKNSLIIDIYPKQDIILVMNHWHHGSFEPIEFLFSHEKQFGPNTSDEYATLLENILQSDHALFPTREELEVSWKLIEDLESIRKDIPFVLYPDKTLPV